jgi:UDP-N-acetylglucosamine--N-acetylmuramyl-(pentapeptide) pyrophosphoryl-undecaprenol N-acetylglucosamine transferase
MSTLKICISGGHLTPAVAFMEYAQNQNDVEIVFIGRQYSTSDKSQKAREAIEVDKLKIPFIPYTVPKFNNKNPLQLVMDTLMYPVSIFLALKILLTERPTVFLSFGGYLAVPIAIGAWLLGIPIITHEQTVVGGSANQVIAKIAKYVALSFTQSKKYFPNKKTKVTGNPIRTSLIEGKTTKPKWAPEKLSKPLLYITGGNQGSYIINNTIRQILPQLTRKYFVVHACGSSTTQMNYKRDLQKAKRKLSARQQDNYYVTAWISEKELAWVLQNASLAVCRSGANTVQELITNKVPAIFIPLPFAKNDEQQRNAQMVAKTGGANIIHQNNLNPQILIEEINKKMKIRKALKKKLDKVSIPSDGAAKLFKLVASL